MIVNNQNKNINLAVKLLQQGEIVALPTETVYGLAADATNAKAIEKIYEAKNRPSYNPLIVHVSNIEMAENYCYIDDISRYLMKIFWCGPLSIVLPLRETSNISKKALAGLSTIAIRAPQNIFNSVIKAFGKPIVAPSANISGAISPTNAQAVQNSLSNKVKLIIDGGICSIGLESTIVKLDNNKLYILRFGGITKKMLKDALEKFNVEVLTIDKHAKIEAPGMLTSHYAPNAYVRLNITELYENEALLAFGKQTIKNKEKALKILNLSETGNLSEAAYNLFNYLSILDNSDVKNIAVAPIPNIGIGEAINDRLTRASIRNE